MEQKRIFEAYKLANEKFADFGIDTDKVVKRLNQIIISLHCWQTDDVGGFETKDTVTDGGGIQATGNYPGKARTINEAQEDLEKVMSLLPGMQKINLHAMYGDFSGSKVDRDEIQLKHYEEWIHWAKSLGTGLDFNATCFAHPKANSGFTLSSKDRGTRDFWVEHVTRCREIADEMGKQTGKTCIHNLWIPDGSKDIPVDRFTNRKLLKSSLDKILEKKYSSNNMKDSLESKLFGIGSEAMVVGSYDFYLGYAIQNKTLICLDNGHFHPTEQVSDKISACLQFIDELLLHLTRGIRWDSDHVATLNDDILNITSEINRSDALDKVNVALDFFDASINRIGAYVIGTRAVQKAFLRALLEPVDILKKYENQNKLFERLFLLEEQKSLPWGAVWDYYCLSNNIVPDSKVISEVNQYEKENLSKRA